MTRTFLSVAAVLLACSCTGPAERRLRSTLDDARQNLRRGNFEQAKAVAQRGSSEVPAGSAWAWTFQLLRAEVLLEQRQFPEAKPLLDAELPSGPEFDPLRARQKSLAALAQIYANAAAQALPTLATARTLAPGAPDVQLEIQVLEGSARLRQGEWGPGEQTMMAAAVTAAARNDRWNQARAWTSIGMGGVRRNRFDEALGKFDRALSLADLDGTTVYAAALTNAGICYARLGEFERALTLQRRAVDFYAGHGRREDYASALGELGNTYFLQGDTERALPLYQQALAEASAANSTTAAMWAGNLAGATIDLKRWDEAERSNEDARRLKTASGGSGLVYNQLNAAEIARGRGQLDRAARLFKEALADPSPDPGVRWTAHEGLAEVALARSRRQEAASHFEAALDSIEKARDDLGKLEFKVSFLARLIRFYQSYVDALIKEGDIPRALEVADSSRGRVLAARSNSAAPQMASAADVRKIAAGSKTVLLSYWLAPSRSYLWVVAADGIHGVELRPAAEIAALVRDHKKLLDNTAVDALAPGGTGERLYAMLVKPASQWIPPDSRVIVVPDGALHGLNFETLTVPEPSRRYWIQNVQVEVAPGLWILSRTPAATANSRSLLLIGDPVARPPDFPRLKYARDEVSSVAGYFPSDAVKRYTAEQASPEAYKAAGPERFAFVHFTAHATTNWESPLDSAVILSGPDNAFKLYARDVAEVPLTADLVTVSACRSAGERVYSGEGLVGFAWAFLRAGARRVIAGLWDVDDQSTATLMDQLYAEMKAGRTPGQALRTAKLALLATEGNFAKPYYWGPLQVFTAVP